MKKQFYIYFAVICLTVLWLCANNFQTTTIYFVSSHINIPLAIVILTAFILGALSASVIFRTKSSQQNQGNRKLQEWEIQDAKLAAQVKSDREKQLEAKIATLESALKTALKKGS